MSQVKGIGSVLHFDAFDDFRPGNGTVHFKFKYRFISRFFGFCKLPAVSRRFAVGRILFAVDRIAVAAERQAEKIAAQILEQGNGGEIGTLILPGADEIGLNRFLRIFAECHGRMLSAVFREEQFDVSGFQIPAGGFVVDVLAEQFFIHDFSPDIDCESYIFNDYNMFQRKIKSWRRERYPGRKEHEENKEPEDQNQPDLTVS